MEEKKELINYLKEFVSPKRFETFKNIIQYRTRYLTVVLEDIYQSQNASAVLRTADCFGIQDVHIIENHNKYQINPDVSLGSDKWLSLNKYTKDKNNTLAAINKLKQKGYKIVATTPHTNDIELENFDITNQKTAIMLGSEVNGLSKEALDHADVFLKIPMYGFTESFNISVSASMILHHLSWKLHQSDINWQLTASEKEEIEVNWLLKSIKKSDLLLKKFYSDIKK